MTAPDPFDPRKLPLFWLWLASGAFLLGHFVVAPYLHYLVERSAQ